MDRIGVLFLTNYLPVGGFETHLLSILKELDKAAFHPVVCTLKEGGPLADEFRAAGIPVYTRLQSHRLDPVGILRLARIMKREGIALLDTDLQRNTVFVGALAARLVNLPAALISAHVVAHMDRDRIVEWPARFSLGRYDRVIALFEEHRRQLVQDEGIDPEKVLILWNGVDVEEFRPRPPSDALRTSLGIPPDAPTIGIVASLFRLKAHDMFLEAASRILERCAQAHFLVIGQGPERSALEARSHEMGLGRAVHFLGMRRDLSDLLQLIDVNVLTSLWEALPISILEGMACANPTVTTRVGALPEMVADGETGFLVDVGDVEAFAGAVVRLLNDPDLRRTMGRAARRRVENLFDIHKIVREREALYRNLVLQGHAPSR